MVIKRVGNHHMSQLQVSKQRLMQDCLANLNLGNQLGISLVFCICVTLVVHDKQDHVHRSWPVTGFSLV